MPVDDKQCTLAFVTDAVYPYSKGGKEKRLYDITKQLSKSGYRVDIYTMKWWTGESNISHENVHLHALCHNYRMYVGKRRSIKQSILFGLACTRLIGEQFDVIDVDQIPFSPLFTTWFVCKLKRKKMFATWHEVWGEDYWRQYLKFGGRFAAVLERFASKLPTKIIAVSDTTASELGATLGRFSGVITIPNSVNAVHIKNIMPASESYDVIFAARLLAHKRADLVIKAVALLKASHPKISCLIIGVGPEEVTLKQLSHTLKVEKNVHFHDFYENIDDLYALIKSAKIYVLPSEREGFGLGLLEANTCGTYTITTDASHNAAKSLVSEGENGSIVQPTSEALANAVESNLSRKVQVKLNISERYGFEQTLDKLVELYTS